jgi:hypothetical protein
MVLICPEARDVRGRTLKSKKENRVKYAGVKKRTSPERFERGSSLELSQTIIELQMNTWLLAVRPPFHAQTSIQHTPLNLRAE